MHYLKLGQKSFFEEWMEKRNKKEARGRVGGETTPWNDWGSHGSMQQRQGLRSRKPQQREHGQSKSMVKIYAINLKH